MLRSRALACASVALFAFAAANFLRVEPGTTKLFSPAELKRVSIYLESGYRDGSGAGRLFVGTLLDPWLDLDAGQQHSLAEEAVAVLRHAGVEEVMLFDRLLRLQVHATGGRLRTPLPSSHPTP